MNQIKKFALEHIFIKTQIDHYNCTLRSFISLNVLTIESLEILSNTSFTTKGTKQPLKSYHSLDFPVILDKPYCQERPFYGCSGSW